jgi:hypothetical protein
MTEAGLIFAVNGNQSMIQVGSGLRASVLMVLIAVHPRDAKTSVMIASSMVTITSFSKASFSR